MVVILIIAGCVLAALALFLHQLMTALSGWLLVLWGFWIERGRMNR